MDTLLTRAFHCSTRPYLPDLIDFIEEKVTEALQRRIAPRRLSTKCPGLAPIKDRISKGENELLMAALSFLIFYVDLKSMSSTELADFVEKKLRMSRGLVDKFAD